MNISLTFTYTDPRGTPTIQWYRSGIAIQDGDFGGVIFSGATAATLNITNLTPDWYGDYYAILRNEFGCQTQSETYVVGCPATITVQPESVEVVAGTTAEFSFEYTGIGNFAIQWYKDDVAIEDGLTSDGATYSGATTATLTIEAVNANELGTYHAVLTDYSYPDCSVSTNDVELTCPCPELLYYNFEEYVTFAEAQRFENVADANWLFWFGLVTSNPGGVVAGKIGNAMFNSTGEARVIRTPTTTGDFSNCLDFTGRSWTIRFWFKPVGPQAFGGQDILNIGDGGSSPQISVSWGGTLNARYPGSYVFVANLRNPDAVQTPDGGPIDPTSGLDWTRCVMTYDVATETFWMKTDNNAFLEYPYPGFALGTQGCGLAINAGSNSFYIDELAVIPDVVWSEADATYDWNGGAGRTYPDLP